MTLNVLVVDLQARAIPQGNSEAVGWPVCRDPGGLILSAGLVLSGVLSDTSDLLSAVRRTRPHVIFAIARLPELHVLEQLAGTGRRVARPLVMLVADAEPDFVRFAGERGVDLYAGEELTPLLLRSMIEVSRTHYEARKGLLRELQRVQNNLAERGTINRAKTVLMRTLGITEQEAYRRIRKCSMDANKKMVDIAEGIVRPD